MTKPNIDLDARKSSLRNNQIKSSNTHIPDGSPVDSKDTCTFKQQVILGESMPYLVTFRQRH